MSGNYYRHNKKATVEGCKRLDIRQLNRRGCLEPGYKYECRWTLNGEPDENIWITVHKEYITLAYRFKGKNNDDWQDVAERVSISVTPCHFGNNRSWFLCPGCGKRIAILYLVAGFFRCRHCCKLTYRSSQESKFDRALRKKFKLQDRLRIKPLERPLFKPKNMHQKTFDRLRHELDQIQMLSNVYLRNFLNRIC